MPFFDSNIPSKIFYSPIGFEILRLTTNTSDQLTLNRKSIQGSQKSNIKTLLNERFCRFLEIFSKFTATAIILFK